MENKKRRIQVLAPSHIYLDISFFECTTTELINKLIDLPKAHKDFLQTLENGKNNLSRNIRGNFDPTWHLIDEYRFDADYTSDGIDIMLQFFRWETDEELNKRIETEKKRTVSAQRALRERKKNEERKEKELYLKLKEKYETEK